MAANRYARIYHSDHHYINLRFPSAEARRKYAIEFRRYHEGHDHDGEVPRFEDTPAATIGNMEANTVHDAHAVSIDGYATYEIEAYHNPDRWNTYDRGRYRPPTCCVPPVISINRTFIDASTLTRHELSSIFMDMPEEDFENLLKSVETDGFKDPIIRMIDTQVLDGWHRYRAAKELNLLRKLRFQQWNEKDEGDPAAFVYARNMERRHHPKSVRAQIAVSFNERFGHGGDRRSSHPRDDLKTRQEIADELGVSTATIDRAIQIEKAGQSEVVMSGEKSVNQVLYEMETLSGQVVSKGVYFLKNTSSGDIKIGFTHQLKPRISALQTSASDRLELLHVIPDGTRETEAALHEKFSELLVSGEWFQGTPELLEFINEVIAGKKSAGEVITEETLKSLWEQIHPAISAWKKTRDGVGHASKGMFIHATLRWEGLPADTETDVKVLKELLKLLTTKETNILEKLIRKQLDGKRLWDDDASDETEPETDKPEDEVKAKGTETQASDREASKLLKQKKQVLKAMWETRLEAARFYTGDGDTDLNLHLTLPELEKGFAKNNPVYAEPFRAAMQRTSVATFSILTEFGVLADIDVLEKENRALTTYIGDLRNWERADWSPDTNWILPRIGAKKEASASETEPVVPEETLDSMWEQQVKPAIAIWKSERKGTGLGNASKTMFLSATKKFFDMPRDAETTVKLLEKLHKLLVSDPAVLTFERYIKDQVNGASIWQETETPDACEIDASPLGSVEDEGLSEIDWQYDRNQRNVLRTLIAPLLEKIGATDAVPVLNQELRRNIAADIMDVFISYENPPADKQMVMILLDVIDAILSEPIE